jgi:hypothetical protein
MTKGHLYVKITVWILVNKEDIDLLSDHFMVGVEQKIKGGYLWIVKTAT